MRCSIYLRVSTPDQAKEDRFSIPMQRRACIAIAASRGDGTPVEYVDEGISAYQEGIDHRPALCRLLDDARAGRFGILVVYSLDRLARDPATFYDCIRILEKAHVELLSATQYFDESVDGHLIRDITVAVSRAESARMGKRISDALREKQRKGYHTGRIPYGYAPGPDKTMVIDESQAAGYRLAVELIMQGEDNLSQLSRMLNAAGYRTGRGMPWSHRSVLVMLRNSTYLGTVTLPDGTQLPGSHPPLLERPDWERVQSFLREWHKPRRGRRSKTAYPLSGILRCNRCGERMSGTTLLRADGRAYLCARRKKEGRTACPGTCYFYAVDVEEQVARVLEGIVLGPGWQAAVEAELAPAKRRGPSLAEIRRQERALMDMYQLGTFAGDKAEFQRRWGELQVLREQGVAPARPAVLQAGALLEQGLGKLWRDSPDQAARRKLALLLFRAVYIDGPGMRRPEIKRLEWRPEVEILLRLLD